MDILILGGGLAGCTIGYLLVNKGHKVTILEKEDDMGGICQTYELGGVKHEFGPHILYAKRGSEIENFFKPFFPNFIEKKYFPMLSVDGEIDNLCYFPVTVTNVLRIPKEDQEKAIEELYKVNLDKPDYSNLENYVISRVGRTMYEYFFKNYNIKQWGVHPRNMDAEWARFRNLYLRPSDYGMFGDAWQGHPGSYREFFSRLTQDITRLHGGEVVRVEFSDREVRCVRTKSQTIKGNFYISTIPIDCLLNRQGTLAYRGTYKIFFLLEGKSGLPTYLTTFPNNYSFTRIMDYKLQTAQDTPNSLISMAFPHASGAKNLPEKELYEKAVKFVKEKLNAKILDFKIVNNDYCYPLTTFENLKKFKEYLKKLTALNNIITMGRLGLYAYISMCTTVEQSMKIAKIIEQYPTLNPEERMEFYNSVRSNLL